MHHLIDCASLPTVGTRETPRRFDYHQFMRRPDFHVHESLLHHRRWNAKIKPVPTSGRQSDAACSLVKWGRDPYRSRATCETFYPTSTTERGSKEIATRLSVRGATLSPTEASETLIITLLLSVLKVPRVRDIRLRVSPQATVAV